MPRRELLTQAERAGLMAFPTDESELIRLATLSVTDITFIRHHRGHHNRLGIAVQMQYLRFPGRVLAPSERPHPGVLGIVAAQVRAAPAAWDLYATRDETRREHLQELLKRLGKKQFTRAHYRPSVESLLPLALQSTQGIVLARALIDELRTRGVLLPSIRVIEQLCAAALTRAQRATFRRLTAPLTDAHRAALDALLVVAKGESMSPLAWMRQPAGAPSANVILQHLARLHAVRAVGLPADIGRDVHQNRLLRLVREGGQTAVFQLLDLEPERRYATLVAILLDTAATLTDSILELHERLMGRFFSKARHRFEQAFTSEGEVLHEKLRLFSRVGAALVAARREQTDPYAAIEAIVPWDQFEASIAQAEELSRDEHFDPLALVTNYFPTLRKYAPTFLTTFEFRGARSAQDLLAAIDTLREMNASGARHIPAAAPLGFVPPKWARSVGRGENIDRRFYEFCALSELSGRLRAGDVYVVGSRQFRDFDEYLLSPPVFAAQYRDNQLGLAIPTSSKEYLGQRLAELREALEVTNRLAAADELTDARISARGLLVAPIQDDGPPEAKLLRSQAYGLLPRVKITDLLLEVDRWTGFTEQFTHLKTGAVAADRNLLLTALLADAFNLGLEKMAEACPGTSLAKLAWRVAWHIRDDTYSKALAIRPPRAFDVESPVLSAAMRGIGQWVSLGCKVMWLPRPKCDAHVLVGVTSRNGFLRTLSSRASGQRVLGSGAGRHLK